MPYVKKEMTLRMCRVTAASVQQTRIRHSNVALLSVCEHIQVSSSSALILFFDYTITDIVPVASVQETTHALN
jgi:hypothetical protein